MFNRSNDSYFTWRWPPHFRHHVNDGENALSQPTLQRIFALLIVLVLTRFFIIAPAHEEWTNYWLVKDGREGVAVVTKFLWTGHDVVTYKYRVNQNEYTGQDFRSWQNPQYAHVMVGEQTTVFFSASHPWLSRINLPRTAMVEGLPVLLLVWLLIGMLLIAVINPKSKWALSVGAAI